MTKFHTAYQKKAIKSETLKPQQKLTEQHHAIECDVNRIVAQAKQSGQLPGQDIKPVYGDISSDDFQTMQDTIAIVKSDFESLPADIRAEFNNQPEQLLEAMANPDQREHLTKIGIFESQISIDPEQSDQSDLNDQKDLKKDPKETDLKDPKKTE